MAFKNQTETELKNKRSRKYVFEHKNTKEIEGFEDLDLAKSIAGSESWVAANEAAKELVKKFTPKEPK